MLTTVIGWLEAAAAIALLARLRGWRSVIVLGVCLLLLVLGTVLWSLTLAFSAKP